MKNLASYYNNHLHYEDSHTEFANWLEEIKLHLQNIHRTSGPKEEIGGKLENMTVSEIRILVSTCFMFNIMFDIIVFVFKEILYIVRILVISETCCQ